MIKKKLASTLIVSLFVLSVTQIAMKTAIAQTSTELYVAPSEIRDPTMGFGSSFTVNITVAEVVDLYAWNLSLTYGKHEYKNVLYTNSTLIKEGSFLKDWAASQGTDTTFTVTLEVLKRKINIDCRILGEYDGATGNGTLATITFIVEETGATLLQISNDKLYDDDGTEILHEKSDGYFSNLLTTVYLDPENVTKVEGETFNANVNISYAEDLYAWDIRLSWNTTILNVTQVKEGPFLKGQPEGSFFVPMINQTGGYVDMGCTTVGDHLGVVGNGTLARLTFLIESGGTTTISFSSITLLDHYILSIDPRPLATGANVTGLAHPVASFTFSPSEPLVKEPITFDAAASYDPDGSITSYEWNFGDETNGTGEIAEHTYSVAALYSVTLTVTDNDGLTGNVTKLVRLLKPLNAEPDRGPVGTKVTVSGYGFYPYDFGDLYFDDHFLNYNVMVDENGTFTSTFNIPLSEPGPHDIKVFFWSYGEFNVTTFTVIDTTPLEVNVEVGEIHFRGEMAEFYIQTVFKGTPTNVTSTQAKLYKPDGTELLTVQQIAAGLYKAPYTIPTNAPNGTYILVIEATYQSDTEYVDSKGASFDNFLLSPTLTNWNAWLVDLKGSIATIKTDVGTIKTDVANIDAAVYSLAGTTATIRTDVGTIKTDVANIKAKIVSIEGNTATIKTDLGDIKTDIANINATIVSIEGNTATILTSVGTIKTDLTAINAKLVSIGDNVATILTSVGTIKTDLTAINAKLVSIGDNVATILTSVGTIKTDIANINATIVSIEGNTATILTTIQRINGTITLIQGNIATIQTDIGDIKAQLHGSISPGWVGGATSSIITTQGTFNIFTLTTSNLVEPPTLSEYVLAIRVSGGTGTGGVTQVVLPEELFASIVSSIEAVSVTIDDEVIPFAYAEDSGAYILRISYAHSTHTIKVYLLGVPETLIPPTAIIAIIVSIGVAVSINICMLKIRKPRTASP